MTPWETAPDDPEWRDALPPLVNVRVHAEWQPTRNQTYELCSAGGLRFIRRTTHKPYKVEESPRLVSKRANELWQRVLTGQVC